MIVEACLLSPSDVEHLAQRPERSSRYGSLQLCTIMEPIEVIDSAKKGRNKATCEEFLRGWIAMTRQMPLMVVTLDAERLTRSLFERTDEQLVVSLWPGVEATGLTANDLIGRIVRRLILRPYEYDWWGPQPFETMEGWYDDDSTNR